MKMLAFRLQPGADLKQSLKRIVDENGLLAGCIVSGVGSLARARLRMPSAAGEAECFVSLDEPTEIISLVGTLSPDGLHLHIGLGRRDGQCVGGHLVDGCIVHTTAELIVGEISDLEFRRTPDTDTGYLELRVSSRIPDSSQDR